MWGMKGKDHGLSGHETRAPELPPGQFRPSSGRVLGLRGQGTAAGGTASRESGLACLWSLQC